MSRLGVALCLMLGTATALAAPVYEWTLPPELAAATGEKPGEGLVDETQRLKDQLEAIKRESRERQALTIARGRAYVRLARAGLLPLSEGLEALAAHASRLERLRRALARDLERQRQLTADQLHVARALTELETLRPADRKAIDRARTAVAAAQERDQAFERAFHSDWNPSRATAVYGAVAQPGTHLSEGGFAALRGHLPFPIAGRSEIRKLRSPTGTGNALLMLSATGSTVRAVYAGRVAFADDYPNLGNTVILDHGNQYYTVSAHLQGISVKVGEELAAGERIGTVGIYESKPGLLFEVRAGRDTVNTPEWFGI